MTVTQAIISTLLIAAVIFLERLFPFAIFSKRQPGKVIHFFETYIPPVVMLGLLIYSLRSISFASFSQWVPSFAGLLFTALTYLWKKNSLLSIVGGTFIYMILFRII